MKTMLNNQTGSPYTVDTHAHLLGEIIAWELPKGLTVSHSDLGAKLTASGLDPALARALCARHAFVRAVRAMAAAKLLDKVVETPKEITFQFAARIRNGRSVDYKAETSVTLTKATGDVTCPDATVQARAIAELDKALKERKGRDITRLLKHLFDKHADLFTVKAGCYFVPHKHTDLIDKASLLVSSLGGRMQRLPVAEGTPQGDSTVQQVVTDGLMETLESYEEAIHGLSMSSRVDVVARAQAKLVDVADKIAGYDKLLGTHKARLEDHLAYLAALIRKQANPPEPVGSPSEEEEDSFQGDESEGEDMLGPVPSLVGVDPASVDVEIGDGLVLPPEVTSIVY